MTVGDEFDFISGVIASHIVFDDVLNKTPMSINNQSTGINRTLKLFT